MQEQKMGTRRELQIDSSHCRAICDEIGERLRAILAPETPEMPAQLQLLLERLAEQDRELAPSIAPSMDDMVWQPLVPAPIGFTQAAV